MPRQGRPGCCGIVGPGPSATLDKTVVPRFVSRSDRNRINVFRFNDSCQEPQDSCVWYPAAEGGHALRAVHNRQHMPWRPIALLLLCAATLNADTYPRQMGIDAVHYVFRIGLSDQSSEV